MKTIYRRGGESIDSLIRRYRRARMKEGIKSVLVIKEAYEKPSQRKRRKRNAAAFRRGKGKQNDE